MKGITLGIDDYCHSILDVIGNLQEGQRIRFPEDNELFIDIDTAEAFEDFGNRRFVLYTLLKAAGHTIDDIEVTPSKSGLPHRHIVLRLSGSVTMEQRIIFQLALGSDYVREMMNYAAWLNGESNPSIFIEEER